MERNVRHCLVNFDHCPGRPSFTPIPAHAGSRSCAMNAGREGSDIGQTLCRPEVQASLFYAGVRSILTIPRSVRRLRYQTWSEGTAWLV
jgi:hypothetical protein